MNKKKPAKATGDYTAQTMQANQKPTNNNTQCTLISTRQITAHTFDLARQKSLVCLSAGKCQKILKNFQEVQFSVT